MNPGDWARIERIYHEALALDPGARGAFLDRACADDAVVRREVESLLRFQTSAEPFLEGSALQEAATLVDPADSFRAPQIPGYTILDLIGEGGMGVVYLAEQDAPLARRVALKLIKPGMDSRQIVERFETERQALARMDHPNIAAVFDAGTTTDGRPFFVMEFVAGAPITEYCDRQRLSTRDRLELFLQVCAAVQHAHQKGVIHRDLKPSNVLVSSEEAHARPKVIDFGIAKAIQLPVADRGGVTEQGTLVGTPEYMSPEQAAFSPDIDTTSDVYTLGVLLHELLVGTLPFDSKVLRQAGHDEMRRVIRESDPPRPSSRLTDGEANPDEVAAVRQTDVARLTRDLKGDLDWIVLKALERDRRRRYPTVSALAADVDRYLADKPLEARPPTAAYRIRKFVRRYRGAVAAVAALVVVLAAGLSMTLIQFVRAESARTEAEVQRQQANRERAEADKHRQAAEAATREATVRRNDAERATADANDARRVATREAASADAARREAEYRSYVATIAAADGELRANFHPVARERLLSVAPDLRGWEWHHLFLKSDPSLVSLPSKTPCANWYRNWSAPLQQAEVAPGGFVQFNWRSLGALVVDEAGTRISFRRCDTVESWVAGTSAAVTSSVGQILASGPAGDLLSPVSSGADQATWEVHRIRGDSTKPTDRFGPFERQPTCAAVSPDGRRIAIGLLTPLASRGWPLDDVFEIWDAEGPRRIVRMSPAAPRLDDTRGPSACLVLFSPDSSLLATSGAAVRVWRADTGVEIAADASQAGKVSQPIAFSPDGTRLAIGRPTGLVDVLHLGATRRVEQLDGNGFIRVPPPPRDGERSAFVSSRRKNEVLAIAFSPDGRRIVTGTDVNVGVWDVPQGVLTAVMPGHAAPVVAVVVARDGDVITGDATGTVKVWPRDLASARITLPGSSSPGGFSLAVSADGSVAAISLNSGGLSAWHLGDEANRTEVVLWPGSGRMEPQRRLITSHAPTTDGRHVLTGERDGTVRTQTTSPGSTVGATLVDPVFVPECERPGLGTNSTLQLHAPIYEMAIGPDGRSLAFRQNNCLIVRDLLTLKTLATLHELPTGFAFRPDGTLFVASYPERGRPTAAERASRPDATMFRVWDWRTNTTRKAVPAPAIHSGPNERYWRLALSQDGRRAALFDLPQAQATVFVWDGDLGRQIGRLPVPFDTRAVALSADGSRVATTGLDGAVRVWDTDRLQLLLTLTDDDSHSGGIAFTRDGRLVAGRSTGGLTVWETQKPACGFCFGAQGK